MKICKTINNIKVFAKQRNYTVRYKTVEVVPNFNGYANILTQDMINKENVKYVLKYDFYLENATITVPLNCCLEFDGGSLRNGTIIGQDTYINDVGGIGIETLFGEGITREGTWRMNEGGGGTVTVDSELSDSSVNPVQNKVIKQALDNKQPILRSGENIKTINGQSVVGSGNIKIDSGGSSSTYSVVFKPAGVYLQADEDGYIDSPVSNEVEVDIYKDGTKTTMRSVEVISYPAGTTASWNTETGKLNVIASADDPADYEGTIVVKAWSTDGGSAIGEASVVGLRKGSKGTAGEKGDKGDKGDATRYDVVMSPSQIRVLGDDAGFCDSPVVKKLDIKVYKDNVETGLRSVINVSAPDGVSVTDWVEDESAVKKITITADDPAEWEGDIVFNVVCTDGKVIKKTLPVVAVRQSLDLTKEHDEITVEQKAMARQNIGVDAELALKANADNVFTKDNTDAVPTAYSQKIVTSGTVYTAIKNTQDSLSEDISKKVDAANVYSKSAIDEKQRQTEEAVAGKADKGSTIEDYGITDAFTKDETNTAITSSVGTETTRAMTAEQELRELYRAVTQSNTIVMTKAEWDAKDWSTESGEANTIYRVSGTNNYADYMFNSTNLHSPIKMAEYDDAMDDEPTTKSNNLAKSGGIANFVERRVQHTESAVVDVAITDKYDNVILFIGKDKVLRIPGGGINIDDVKTENLDTKTINNALGVETTENRHLAYAILDKYDNIIEGVTANNEQLTHNLDTNSKENKKSDSYLRNTDKEEFLINDAIYDIDSGTKYATADGLKKRLQLMIVTDTHLDYDSFKNAIEAAQDFDSVDAIVHLGDFGYVLNPESDRYIKNKPIIDIAKKPLFMTPGNHDAGNASSYVLYSKGTDVLYDRWIKPSVDKKFLKTGEYQEGKCYYFHDFTDKKVRLIMLYPFDDTNELDETYWEAVSYDATAANISVKTYVVGDKINVPGYTNNSFVAVQPVNVTHITSPDGVAEKDFGGETGIVDYEFEKVPRFKAVRWYSWYRQEQLDWFVARLNEAKNLGYAVIVAQHYPCIYGGGTSPAHGSPDYSTRFNNPYRTNSMEFEPRYSDNDKNIIAQILNCFVNGGTINKTVYPYGKSNPSERKSSNKTHTGIYYKQSGLDDASTIPGVVLNYTFEGGGKAVLINGHNHSDSIVKSSEYNLTQIGFLCGTINGVPYADTVRPRSNDKSFDTMTAFTLEVGDEHSYVHLTRLGIDTTIRVDADSKKLICKDNEVIEV